MTAEDLLDKFAQDEGFGNWETVVLNCHHSVIRSVAIAAVNQALRQPLVVGRSEQLSCGRNITTCVFYKEGGKCSNLEYCRDQTT